MWATAENSIILRFRVCGGTRIRVYVCKAKALPEQEKKIENNGETLGA